MLRSLGFVMLIGVCSPAAAQTVQQPVVRQFSGSMTVTVPDRGSAVLGGTSRAAEALAASRLGSSIGREHSAARLRSSVHIHDLQAMDEDLLAGGSNPSRNDVNRWANRLNERFAAPRPSPIAAPEADPSKAAKFERLALEAERKGNTSLAALHRKMAAKHRPTSPTQLSAK